MTDTPPSRSSPSHPTPRYPHTTLTTISSPWITSINPIPSLSSSNLTPTTIANDDDNSTTSSMEPMGPDDSDRRRDVQVPIGHPGIPPHTDMGRFNRRIRQRPSCEREPTLMSFGKSSFWTGKSSVRRMDLMRMGKSKVVYVIVNGLYTFVALAALVLLSFTWTDYYVLAPLLRVLNRPLLILSTATSVLLLTTGILGYAGAFLHRKPVIVASVIMGLVGIIMDISTGYMAYRFLNRVHWDEIMWREWEGYNGVERVVVQRGLGCCGYMSGLDRAEEYWGVGTGMTATTTTTVVATGESVSTAVVVSDVGTKTTLMATAVTVVSFEPTVTSTFIVNTDPVVITAPIPLEPSPTTFFVAPVVETIGTVPAPVETFFPKDAEVSFDQGGGWFTWWSGSIGESVKEVNTTEIRRSVEGSGVTRSLASSDPGRPICRLDPGRDFPPITPATLTVVIAAPSTAVTSLETVPTTTTSAVFVEDPVSVTTTEEVFGGLDRRHLPTPFVNAILVQRRQDEIPFPDDDFEPGIGDVPSSPTTTITSVLPLSPPTTLSSQRTLPAAPPPPIITMPVSITPQPPVGVNADLPGGCVGPYTEFAKTTMKMFYVVAFSVIPLALLQFVTGILVANHVYD